MPKIRLWYFIVCLAVCQGCFLKAQQPIDTGNLKQISNINQELLQKTRSGELSNMRAQILRETAMSMGAQAGLAWASSKINAQLSKDSKKLSQIFDFNAMMLSHGVLPPILAEGGSDLNLADPNTIRIADKTYKIITQAHFATVAPHWRDYLWLNYTKPNLPDKSLLPRNNAEQKIWRHSIQLGWDQGIQQASSIFQQNLARLRRDYNGMIIYRRLLQYHMINAPFVSHTDLGITGDGSDMRINDQVLRITDFPRLQKSSKNWQAIVVKQ